MTHVTWRDVTRVTWLRWHIYGFSVMWNEWERPSYAYLCVTWLIHMGRHNSFTWADMTHSHGQTWLIHMGWLDAFTLTCVTFICVSPAFISWIVRLLWRDSFDVTRTILRDSHDKTHTTLRTSHDSYLITHITWRTSRYAHDLRHVTHMIWRTWHDSHHMTRHTSRAHVT